MVEPRASYQRPAHLIAYPYLSLDERDQRWRATWQAMEDQSLDCVLVPPATGAPSKLSAVARYLTHVGGWDEPGVAVILPLGAEPIVIVPRADEWRQMQPWCGSLHEPEGDLTATLVTKLRNVALPRHRVGVVGLHDRNQASLISHDLIAALEGDLTLACEDFTSTLDRLRATKSEEEVAFIEQSARIANESFRRTAAAIRSGMTERAIWAALLESTLSLGSDTPVRIRQASQKPTEGASGSPGSRSIGPGWTSLMSLEAAWGGYRARCAQPITFDAPSPRDAALMSLTADIWNSLVGAIEPDTPTHAVQTTADREAARLRPANGPLRAASVAVSIRGCGLGEDEPMAAYRDPKSQHERGNLITRDSCFFLGIQVSTESRRLRWGDSVVVTGNGVRRLGNNPQSFLSPC